MFIHQPFPSSEIFRCLANRDELLRGLLCADHIGFHLFEWAKNFLACCRRLLACSFEVTPNPNPNPNPNSTLTLTQP